MEQLQHPMKISVHWSITVSWHDNLLFKCTTALFSPPMVHCRQLIHYHWVDFFFPSPSSVSHPLTPSHHPPPPCFLVGGPQCENLIMFCYWTCKLNWTESHSPGLSKCCCICVSLHAHAFMAVFGTATCTCNIWWINLAGLCLYDCALVGTFPTFLSAGLLWQQHEFSKMVIGGPQPATYFTNL